MVPGSQRYFLLHVDGSVLRHVLYESARRLALHPWIRVGGDAGGGFENHAPDCVERWGVRSVPALDPEDASWGSPGDFQQLATEPAAIGMGPCCGLHLDWTIAGRGDEIRVRIKIGNGRLPAD